jgi:hypothetical protein
MQPGVAVGVFVGVGTYVAFIVAIVVFVTRRVRRRLDARTDALGVRLEGVGRRIGDERASRWRGKSVEYEVDGRRVFVEVLPFGRSTVRVNLRLPTQTPLPHIRAARERGIDRFGKKLGLNREVQTGDEGFDAAVYINSRDRDEDVLAVLAHDDVKMAIRELLDFGYLVEMSARGVEAYQYKYVYGEYASGHEARVVALLGQIARRLPSFDLSSLAPQHSPQNQQALFALLGAGVALGLTAAAGLMAATPGDTVDPRGYFIALGIGGGLYLVYLAAVTLAVRGRSNGLGLVALFAFVGIIFVPMIGAGVPLWLNRRLDTGATYQRVVTVTNVGGKEPSLWVESWHPGKKHVTLTTVRRLRRTLAPGDHVFVTVHPGHFGWEWADPVVERAP